MSEQKTEEMDSLDEWIEREIFERIEDHFYFADCDEWEWDLAKYDIRSAIRAKIGENGSKGQAAETETERHSYGNR